MLSVVPHIAGIGAAIISDKSRLLARPRKTLPSRVRSSDFKLRGTSHRAVERAAKPLHHLHRHILFRGFVSIFCIDRGVWGSEKIGRSVSSSRPGRARSGYARLEAPFWGLSNALLAYLRPNGPVLRVLRRATPVAQERSYRAPEKSMGPGINNSPQQRRQNPVTTSLA